MATGCDRKISGPAERATPMRQSTSCPTTRTGITIGSGKSKIYRRARTSISHRRRRSPARRRQREKTTPACVRERHRAPEPRSKGQRGMCADVCRLELAAYTPSRAEEEWLWISYPLDFLSFLPATLGGARLEPRYRTVNAACRCLRLLDVWLFCGHGFRRRSGTNVKLPCRTTHDRNYRSG